LFRAALFAAGYCLLGCSAGSPEHTSNGAIGAQVTTAQAASPPSQPLLASSNADDPQDAIAPPPNDCDIDDGGCVSQCTTDQNAICAVVNRDVLCELIGFAGASTEVACGQRATVGTACCGACGCVPVEVFFDGKNCWQGVPTCTAPEVSGMFLNPHAPGAADGGWTSAANNGEPGQFYLGATQPPGDASAEDGGSEGGAAGGDGMTVGAAGFDSGVADADAGVTTSDLDATTGSADTDAD
jgi:hypothetical protein